MKYALFILSLPLVAITGQAAELAIHLVDVKNNPVENLVVYATPKSGVQGLPANTTQLTIDQESKKFAPYVTVMQKGQTINFNNKDDITHHIYSVSGENRFEFKLKANSMKHTQALDTAEEIAMGCNIHDWMSGYALVVDTPYYGKTDKAGKLSLNLRELGEYQITVWHPQLEVDGNRITQSFTLSAQQQTLNIALPKELSPLPDQLGEDDFDFLEEY